MNLLKRLFGRKQKNHFDSIHNLPIYNWFKCRDENDLSYLLKDEPRHGTKEDVDFEELYSVYMDMITEFFKEFGQAKSKKNEIDLISKIVDANLMFVKSGDRFLLNNINVMNERLRKIQLDNMDNALKVDSRAETKKDIAKVGSSINGFVNTKSVVVVQFYTQLTMVNDIQTAS